MNYQYQIDSFSKAPKLIVYRAVPFNTPYQRQISLKNLQSGNRKHLELPNKIYKKKNFQLYTVFFSLSTFFVIFANLCICMVCFSPIFTPVEYYLCHFSIAVK